MTRMRTLALAAAVLVSAAGTVAEAAPKAPPKLCNLVTDAGGDVLTGNKTLDVVGGDIATNAKTVTAVIRFAKLSQQDLTSPTGRFYEFTFSYDGRGQSLSVTLDALGTPTWTQGGTGVIDLAKNEIRMHLPVDNLIGRPVLKPNAPLADLLIRTDLGNPAVPFPSSFLLAGDTAKGTKAYPVNAPSCVKVGA
jgi:hypothetical protein